MCVCLRVVAETTAPFIAPSFLSHLNSKELKRRLYREGRPVRYRKGTILLYRLDAWHRGTPPLPGKLRINHHIIWRKASSEWVQWQAYPTPMSNMPTRFLERLSPEQRGLFGFPAVGSHYWNEDTVVRLALEHSNQTSRSSIHRLMTALHGAMILLYSNTCSNHIGCMYVVKPGGGRQAI
eukprot:COSAG03_NODE_326_length_8956_cov_4.802077_4_plen_180_part_00